MNRRTLLQHLAAAVAALFAPAALRSQPDQFTVLQHAIDRGTVTPTDIEGWLNPDAVHRAYEVEKASMRELLRLRTEAGHITERQAEWQFQSFLRELAYVRDRQLRRA